MLPPQRLWVFSRFALILDMILQNKHERPRTTTYMKEFASSSSNEKKKTLISKIIIRQSLKACFSTSDTHTSFFKRVRNGHGFKKARFESMGSESDVLKLPRSSSSAGSKHCTDLSLTNNLAELKLERLKLKVNVTRKKII